MTTRRLFLMCAGISFAFGSFGAWIISDIIPGISARAQFEQQIDSKSAEQLVNLMEEEQATIDVVARVTPAVVSVIVQKPRAEVLNAPEYFFGDISFEEGRQDDFVDVSSGTGFFVSQNGLILTNRHVVDIKNVTYLVVTNDGREHEARLIDMDPILDVAFLQIDGADFPVVTFGDSEKIRIGQTVIAIGNTLSEFRNTVTKGVVSGINRRVTAGISMNGSEVIEHAIQTDAAINPGNSGGPLINLLGEVIGINTAVSIGGEAIAFAIPINQTKRGIEDIQSFGRIVRPWLGIRYVLIEPDQLEGVEEDTFELGALIMKGKTRAETAIVKNSPADRAGIKEDDVLIAVNGEKFTQGRSVAELISTHRPGDQVTITLLRKGETLELPVTLEEFTSDIKR